MRHRLRAHGVDCVRHALKRQVEVARDLLDKLSLSLYPPEFRTAQVAALEPLVTQGAAVIEAQRKAELARAGGRLDVRAWKEGANAVRLSIYAALLGMAAQNGRGKAWAEAFFKKNSSASQRDDDGEPADGDELPDAV